MTDQQKLLTNLNKGDIIEYIGRGQAQIVVKVYDFLDNNILIGKVLESDLSTGYDVGDEFALAINILHWKKLNHRNTKLWKMLKGE
jgi:hypothetical protein